MNLREKIDQSFGEFLGAHHFRETFQRIDELFFGNTIIVFHSEDFLIRFVTDRGDFVIYVSPTVGPEEWCTLDFCLELLGYPWSSTVGLADAEIVLILSKEYLRIASLFAARNLQNTRLELAKLALRPFRPLN
jgi:hypothetical protein